MLNSDIWNHLTVWKQVINIKLDENTWETELQLLNSNT